MNGRNHCSFAIVVRHLVGVVRIWEGAFLPAVGDVPQADADVGSGSGHAIFGLNVAAVIHAVGAYRIDDHAVGKAPVKNGGSGKRIDGNFLQWSRNQFFQRIRHPASPSRQGGWCRGNKEKGRERLRGQALSKFTF